MAAGNEKGGGRDRPASPPASSKKLERRIGEDED